MNGSTCQDIKVLPKLVWGGWRVKQNTIFPQIIVTFVIKTANLTVKTNRPDIILKNTAHKKKLKYAPLKVPKFVIINQ